MAWRFEHCKDCEVLLGAPYDKVHAWLDEYVKRYPVNIYDDYHRAFRHNKVGVEKIKEMWGDKAEMAAKIHLIRDAVYLPLPKPLHKMKESEITKFVEKCYPYFPDFD